MRAAVRIGDDEGEKSGPVLKKKLSRVKVGIAKSSSGPPLTMETGLELTECSPLLGGGGLSNSLEWKWENRENVQRAERDGVKERGRERREDGRKG